MPFGSTRHRRRTNNENKNFEEKTGKLHETFKKTVRLPGIRQRRAQSSAEAEGICDFNIRLNGNGYVVCLLDKLTATFASPLAPGRLSGRRKVPRLRSQRREAHKVLTVEWT